MQNSPVLCYSVALRRRQGSDVTELLMKFHVECLLETMQLLSIHAVRSNLNLQYVSVMWVQIFSDWNWLQKKKRIQFLLFTEYKRHLLKRKKTRFTLVFVHIFHRQSRSFFTLLHSYYNRTLNGCVCSSTTKHHGTNRKRTNHKFNFLTRLSFVPFFAYTKHSDFAFSAFQYIDGMEF